MEEFLHKFKVQGLSFVLFSFPSLHLNFSSCAENCTCTESQTGTEVDATYFSCDAYEDLLNEEADDQGASWQNWNCR